MGEKAAVSKDSKGKADSRNHSPCAAVQSRAVAAPLEHVPGSQRAFGTLKVHDIPVSGGIRPKLKVSTPGDVYEQEADRLAEQVMRMPEPGVRRKPA